MNRSALSRSAEGVLFATMIRTGNLPSLCRFNYACLHVDKYCIFSGKTGFKLIPSI